MGLRTFFTGGPDECRAWTIDDLRQYKDEAAIKAAGKYCQEGKKYVVQDGDVLFFKFNV